MPEIYLQRSGYINGLKGIQASSKGNQVTYVAMENRNKFAVTVEVYSETLLQAENFSC
jgi:hypothetical protein